MIAIQYIGLAVFILGGLGLLIAAFRTNVLWGVGCILLAPTAILYTIIHWQQAKNSFLLQLCGLVVMLVGLYLGGL